MPETKMDLFKVMKDLEYKAVGIDPETNKVQEGYFVSFRDIGLPVMREDFENPWTPTGANLGKINSSKPAAPVADAPPADPANPPTASSQLNEDSDLSAEIGKSMQSYINSFMLTDSKLVMSNRYSVMPGASKVSDTWYAIINGANAINTKQELSDDMKAEVEKAKAKIMDAEGNPTLHYDAYVKYKDEYMSKVKALNRAYAIAFSNPLSKQTWPIEGRFYQEDVNEAFARWSGFGHKNEIEGALALLAAQGIDPAILLIQRAKNRFENSLVHFDKIGQLPHTFILPSKWYGDAEGWTRYTQKDYDSKSAYTESSTSMKAGGSFGGAISIGGSGSKKETSKKYTSEMSNLSLEFEFLVADIFRAGIDLSILNNNQWFLVGDYKKGCISDGTFGQQLKSTAADATFLPSIVTSFILIRNLKISWKELATEWSTYEKEIKAGGSVGIGGFSLGGSYKKGTKERKFESHFDGQTLSVDGTQLVGYVSTIAPYGPHHDSAQFMKTV
jgi:hypothetical protein